MNTKVAFALAFALSFTGIIGNHAEAAKRKPDLIVSAVSAPSPASPNASVVVSSTVKNQGKASAKAFGVAYYLSTSPSSTTGATVLGAENVSSLAAGASVALVTSLAVPGSTTSGTYYVVAVADSTKVIRESNESNNSSASNAVSVQPALSTQASTEMMVWVTDSLTRVRPTDSPGTDTAAAITAARNEHEAFQVVIQAPATQVLSNVNMVTSDLVGPATISQSNITRYREHYVPVHVQSAHVNNGWFAPYSPGDWPDALIPSSVPGGTYPSFPFAVPAGQNQPVWIEVYVPKGTAAGTYTGTVTVTADGVTPVTIPVTLTVWGFTLPDRPALASAFGVYDRSFWIAYQYSAESDQQTLKANLYTALRTHRLGIGAAPGVTDVGGVDALMPWQRFLEVDPGMTDAEILSLKNTFVTNGWVNSLGVLPVDEPSTQAQYDAINQLAPRFQTLGIPLLTTIQNSTAWTAINGSVDIWVPVFYECVYNAAQIPAKLTQGNQVWSYTAGVQPNNVPTWLLDYDLINYRIPAWINYSHSQTGLLYWTTAYWQEGDPWINTANVSSNSGNGEGVLFYPGDKVGAPNAAIPSLRLKAIRDGVEDYDYLALLARLGDPALAASLAHTLAPAWDNWAHNPAALAAAREQAAARIVALGGG